MKDKYLKLTNIVYRVLEFFPESDPLKNRAKDKALVIMEHLILINETSGWLSFQKEKVKVQLYEDIDVLLGYLWIGKTQGWLNASNCLIIANEYEKIKKEIGPTIEPIIEFTQKLPGIEESHILQKTPKSHPKEHIKPVLNNRQAKILEFLSNNEKAQVMDLQKVLPDITKRTIRRDLDELLESGQIIRLGDFNQITYKIKDRTK